MNEGPLDTTQLDKSILTLQKSLELLLQSKRGSTEYEVFRNATVKGFELTLETSGKLLRRALRAYMGSPRAVEGLTYKDLFRHAARHGLITVEAVDRWFEYRDNRNTTAHDYGLAFAEETLRLLPAFIGDARALQERLADASNDSDEA
ncbi:MAG: nucleotidyltransferase substrate binding protein [Candidatus Hydrogenedentes bacterium]|nr:nucleotidyltransferase substrate binding protein [Candidatus Hydrogenedentota bacterium]